ncbi:hypothetical protein ACEWY4_013583 [Coilia grayii]|uniref:Glutathione hydrolase n=1 Tax=Coilia grayii TaxID=363190 RepID=A0ABD1JWV6_9TELE
MAKNSSSDSGQGHGQNGHFDGTRLSPKMTLTSCNPMFSYRSTQATAIKRLGSRVDGRPELDDLSRDPDDIQSLDTFKETRSDPFKRKFWKRLLCEEDLPRILIACVIFAVGVVDPGVIVTDSQLCASLGLEVIRDGGSSVDAAITAALCQGIVHPHISGIGGGGVMLVHDGQKNESMVIDFGETAPSRLQVEMLQHDLQNKAFLSECQECLEDYTKHISCMAAQAIESQRVKKSVSERFREIFSPQDQPFPAGSTLKLSHLAAVLEHVASHGVKEFYSGNVSEEIALTVQANGGVLSRADLANYSAVLQEALTGQFKGYQVFVPPPPNAGGALLSFLNIMEGVHFTGMNGEDGASHWIAESLRAALLMAGGLADPKFAPSVSGTISKMSSKTHAAVLRQMIRNSSDGLLHQRHSALHSLPGGASASSQVLVMGSNDLIVSLSWPFGSGIITPSGILLNSQIMNFSWLTGTLNATWSNQPNRIEAGKRARSWHVPTIVRQTGGRCGQTLVLGAAAGQQALSGVAQVLIKLLSIHKNLTVSVSEGRLHPSLQTNAILVDSEFQEQQVRALRERGHVVQRVEQLCLVSGVERRGDVMRPVPDPRSREASHQIFPGSLGGVTR